MGLAVSSTCARALTCLVQAVEREQTWEDPDSPSALPPHRPRGTSTGSKATRSSSTQQCRLNRLAEVMEPLGELIARIHRHAATDGPRMRAQSRAAAPETTAASPQA